MKNKIKILLVFFALFMILATLNLTASADSTGVVTIDAADNAELYTIIEQIVKNGATKIQVNVSGTLNYETGAAYNSDKLTNLGTIEELTIVGTSANAKFVQTGVGVEGMSVTGGKLVFKNITIEDTTVYSSENGESAWEFCYAEYNGNVEFNNCIIRGEYGGIMTNGNTSFVGCEFIAEKNGHGGVEYAVWINSGSVTFNDCKFTGNRAIKVHEDYGSDVILVVIDNCEFIGITQKPGLAIGNLGENTEIKINNSKFYSCQPGDDNLYIYESDTEVSNFILNLGNNTVSEHILKNVPKVKATYVSTGNIEYWICTDCNKWFSDADTTNEIIDTNSVITPKLVEVNEGKADVSKVAVDEAIKDSSSNTVLLPLQNTQENIDTIQLPASSINDVAAIDKLLEIQTGKSEVTFDNTALKSIVSSSIGNDDITLKIIEIGKDNLNDKQKEIISSKEFEIATVFSIELLSGNQQITNFGGGKVKVKFPFTPSAGTNGTDYSILYVRADGSIEAINTNFENGYLIGELEHFSEYVIAKNKSTTTQPAANPNNTNVNNANNNANGVAGTTNNNEPAGTSDAAQSTTNSVSPKTGDNSIIELWIVMFIVSTIGLIVTIFVLKKKINK